MGIYTGKVLTQK